MTQRWEIFCLALFVSLHNESDRSASLGQAVPDAHGVLGIGSDESFAMAAARALLKHSQLLAKEIVEESLKIAAGIGQFELYNATDTHCEKRIFPKFNQLVLIQPTEFSYHAVLEVTGPETRKTLTVFFWSQSDLGHSRRPTAQFIEKS